MRRKAGGPQSSLSPCGHSAWWPTGMQPKNREELGHFQDNKDENVTAGPQKATVIVASRKQRGSLLSILRSSGGLPVSRSKGAAKSYAERHSRGFANARGR